jgi:outer membrane cobalamin receptor
MLDGRRLNRTDMASVSWMQIPVNTIEKIEIVRGASSVLYGDAAIGGVINIITKKGKANRLLMPPCLAEAMVCIMSGSASTARRINGRTL